MNDPFKKSIADKLAEKGTQRSEVDNGETLRSAEAQAPDNVLKHILQGQQLANIHVSQIEPAPDGQARQDFNEERLRALAESLRRSGVREPIIVTPHGAEPGRFQIVAGERRWRAAQLAGLAEIPCIVDPGLVERKDKVLAQAEENLHRENLNAVEEGAVLAQLMEARGVDVKEAGELIGKTYRQARRLHQLHTAAAPIKRAVVRGQLDARTALEMVRIHNRFAREDSSASGGVALRRIERLIDRFVAEQWSVRKLEQYAARLEGRQGESDDSDGKGHKNAEATATTVGSDVSTADGDPAAASTPALERRGRLLVLNVERIEKNDLKPGEKGSLIAVLESLLLQIRRA